MGRILAISDIHGHARALKCLLERSKYDPQRDELFLLGDYIGKGPDSLSTVQMVQALVLEGAVALRGNHEERLLADSEHAAPYWRPWLPFFSALPYWAETAHYLFVHAGIRPHIPLEQQLPHDLITIREEFVRVKIQIGKQVVFGHTQTTRLGTLPGRIWYQEDKIGIDTGAGSSAYLSLVNLTEFMQYRIRVRSEGKLNADSVEMVQFAAKLI